MTRPILININQPKMKSKLFIFTFSFLCLNLVTSCDNKSANSKTDTLNAENSRTSMNKEQLTDFGKKYYAAWSSQKPENVTSLFAADGSLKINDSTAVGREAIGNLAQRIMTAYPDIKVAMDSIVTKPSGTEIHWTLTGTFFGPPYTGKDKTGGVEFWQFDKDGLLKESVITF